MFPGDYHVLVRTVAFNMEGTNGPDNTTAIPTPVYMPELVLGAPTNSVFLKAGHSRYWQIVTSEGNDLRVSLDLLATNGATELYLGYNAIPTRSVFAVKHSTPFQPDQVLRVPGTASGTNYILVDWVLAGQRTRTVHTHAGIPAVRAQQRDAEPRG